MANLSYRTSGFVKLAFSLSLLSMISLNVIFYQTNSEKASISSSSLENSPQYKSQNWSRYLPEENQSFPFLSEHLISKGNKKIYAENMSVGYYSEIVLTETRTYSLGEEIKVKIILYNARGEKMLRGGDYLRLWIENVKVKAAVSGKVMDNNDGTYSGTVRATWSGMAVIGVSILVRREEIALIYKLYNTYHSLWPSFAEFVNGEVAEVSECSVAPHDNSLRWCNLTADNAGFPWFCVQPNKSGLTCSMWTSTWSGKTMRKVVSPAILRMLRRQSNDSDLVPKKSVEISGISNRMSSPNVPCNKIEPEVTWNRKSPKGFFFKDQWHSMQCTDAMTHTPTAYRECLRGRTLYLHGDSTSGQIIDYLIDILNLTNKEKGQNPTIQTDTQFNFTLSWYAHELPFYHGGVHHHKSVNLAQHILLDKIPSNSRDIIILYLYVHFTINHPDVFKQHLQRLVQSVRKLILRAPGVTIVVRGPHAFMKMGTSKLLISYWGLHYMDILHKEFASLRKNVLFLDYWDMTMARIPTNVHPPTETVINMVHYMMSIICDRN